ncbi:hypothetical protein [Caldinitratiruptor microaerophilus]|uniref:Uncharacterized protein n=1 Tax=Caldinitratiruptor microaerophilus TaxID=671077 RepID=A0AA35CPW4_9FIRM|nr:hypothetical protein [Caldinitratiruptor microaerophilus]BDG61660.1 hypothetical protein caldi_27500 [Caldinitratiruptor microaerophilus]
MKVNAPLVRFVLTVAGLTAGTAVLGQVARAPAGPPEPLPVAPPDSPAGPVPVVPGVSAEARQAEAGPPALAPLPPPPPATGRREGGQPARRLWDDDRYEHDDEDERYEGEDGHEWREYEDDEDGWEDDRRVGGVAQFLSPRTSAESRVAPRTAGALPAPGVLPEIRARRS